MRFSMGDIKRMPESIRSSVRSATILFDLPRVVEELIFNSLDAGATKISVAVGAETCYLKVEDNGCGITRDGLVLLADRYASSKFDQLTDSHAVPRSFGFRGEALSSIANVSLLEVLTKAHGRPNGYRKVMKGSKCMYIGIDDGRNDVGTTVIVRDLFYNQPVRRKLIHSSTKKVLESVKKCVHRISLIHPQISFKVVDMDSDEEMFCATPSSSPLSRLASGYGVEVADSLHELNATDDVLKLSGYVSSPCDTSSVKAFQHIYINSRFISKGTIHKLLNQLASSFNASEHQKGDLVSQVATRSRIQTCSTFILNLCCPRSWYDITFEPSKTSVDFKDWKPIISFIEKSVTRLWGESISRGGLLSDGTGVHVPSHKKMVEAGHVKSYPREEKCRTVKRKGRVQDNPSPISHPFPHVDLQSEKLDHLDFLKGNTTSFHDMTYQFDYPVISYDEFPGSSKGNVYGKMGCCDWRADYTVFRNGNSPVRSKYSAPKKYKKQVDSPVISYDEFPTSSKVNVDREIVSCEWGADYNLYSNENNRTGSKSSAPKKYKKQVDYISQSSFDEVHLKVGARLTDEFKIDISCDAFEMVDVNNTGKVFEKPFLQSCTSRKRQVLYEELLRKPEELDARLTDEYLKSVLPCDPFEIGNVDNISKEFEKPRSQRSTSWKREVLDDESLRISEELEASLPDQYFESDLPCNPFRIGNVDNLSKDFDKPFLQSCISRKRRIFDEESLMRYEDLYFPKENLNYKRRCNLLTENFSSKKLVDSILSGDDFSEENGLQMSSYSIFGSKSHGFGQELDENSWRGYESSSRYEYLADSASVKPDFLYDDGVWDMSSREQGSSCRGVGTYLDFKKYARTEDEIFGFHPQHNLFEVTFPRSSNLFTHEKNWLSSDLDGGNYHAITSNDKLDCHKDQMPSKENGRKQRPRRSHSAPPFYRGKKKFFALNNHMALEDEKCKDRNNDNPEVGEPSRFKRSSAVCQFNSESNSERDLLGYMRESKEGPETCCIRKIEMNEKLEDSQPKCTTSVEDIQDPPISKLKWRQDYPKTPNEDKSSNHRNEDTILDVSSGLLHLAGDLLVPQSISKNFLKDAKVLQQVDKKFIPVVGNGVLAIIDQHAADERIRLEELRQKVLSGEKKITYLDAEQKLAMPEIGYQLLHTYAEQVQSWGWLCNIHSQDSRSFKKNLNILHKQPTGITLVAVPCILGVNLTDVDLLEFLQQLADTDGSSTTPPSVHRVLNSKACRGAIMFGDTLLPSECSLIVEELKQTSLCFQCAHGRPTTAPLVNLNALRKQIEQVGTWKENPDTWHGLRRNAPSLGRAKNRLSLAGVEC